MLGKYVAVANPNQGGAKAAVFFIMFFVFFYGLFIDAASFIYSSEIYPTNIRSRGMALSTTTYFTACIVSLCRLWHREYNYTCTDLEPQTYVTPGATAIGDIGWKYYLVFMCLTVISIVVIYFFYPETKQRSLEELAASFGETVIDVTNEKADTGVGHTEQVR